MKETNAQPISSTDQRQHILIGSVIVSMFIWGLSWPSSKILSSYGGGPEVIAFIRFVIVFLTLLPLLVILKVDLRVKATGLSTLALGGALLAFYNYLFLKGLENGLAGAGGVIVSTLNPIFSYILHVSLSRQRLSKNEALGLVFGILAGAFLIKVWASPQELLQSGNVYFLAAAFIWALLSKTTSRASRYGTSMAFSLWMYLITAGLLGVIADQQIVLELLAASDVPFWINMFVFAVLATTMATSLYFYATSNLGAEKASSFIFLVPASAACSAWIILGERLEWNILTGGLLGVAAVTMINRRPKRSV